ncbi:MAG: T9SS type A sorting domain-containing protein [Candidatus Eisenbacteria bacterium]|uniref:T9SS type A sorting domain-containing protein n=1 Tax=Eiseniibacteriota bacterium TaxID=2212470 RepID=A0A849SKT2_UNCEI|nr:T9SS type A sorting domain-containing protein [Candidatus Eisenbacteria bacterium]
MNRLRWNLLLALPLAGILALVSVTPARALTTEALLDTLQHTGFNYFWFEANPANGLVKDRSTAGSVSSIAATGFGLSAICIGIDHGWVTREQGRARIQTTLDTFRNGPQGTAASGFIGYQGWFYHWLDMNTARRTWDSELSTIDTALLLAGMIDAREYFELQDPGDSTVRATVDTIIARINFNFMRNNDVFIKMGWKPGTGFATFGNWIGYNEAMILYILSIGAPANPIPAILWQAWISGYDWRTNYGYTFIEFPPLFGHQYSHCWIDFRDIQDGYTRGKGIDYFENSRRATLAQHAYCVANPGGWAAYSDTLWGITASDIQGGYLARGAPPAQNDNGTLAPTAVGASIAFAPEIVIPTLHNMYDHWPLLWSQYGFRDAFKPATGWYGPDVLGIDQGPIVMMIENYRTGKPWQRVMKNTQVQNGLALAGFLGAVGVEPRSPVASGLALSATSPNPLRGTGSVRFRLPAAGEVDLALVDVAGRIVRRVDHGFRRAGEHVVAIEGSGLERGVYFLQLRWNGESRSQRVALLD